MAHYHGSEDMFRVVFCDSLLVGTVFIQFQRAWPEISFPLMKRVELARNNKERHCRQLEHEVQKCARYLCYGIQDRVRHM